MNNIWAMLPLANEELMSKFIDDQTEGIPFTPQGKMILLTKVIRSDSLKKIFLNKIIQQNRLAAAMNNEHRQALQTMASFNITSPIRKDNFLHLPPGSFAIQFDFILSEPWYSKDDTLLYPLENPVRKEWVFKLPEMSGPGWKGVFLQACREHENSLHTSTIARLFGCTDAEASNSGNSGCLRFFPSFFDKTGFEVINPHNRTTKAGRQPIYMEVVPEGSKSRFTLLYQTGNKKDAKEHIMDDRKLVGELISLVFTKLGFGAKTGVGRGRAEIVPPPPKKQFDKEPEKKKSEKKETGKYKGLAALKGAIQAKQTGKQPVPGQQEELVTNLFITSDREDEFLDFRTLETLLKEDKP